FDSLQSLFELPLAAAFVSPIALFVAWVGLLFVGVPSAFEVLNGAANLHRPWADRRNLGVLLDWTDIGLELLDIRLAFLDVRFDLLDVWLAFLDIRFDLLDVRLAFLDVRFAFLDVRFDLLDVRFAFLDVRFDLLDVRLAFLDVRFDLLDVRLELLDASVARYRAADAAAKPIERCLHPYDLPGGEHHHRRVVDIVHVVHEHVAVWTVAAADVREGRDAIVRPALIRCVGHEDVRGTAGAIVAPDVPQVEPMADLVRRRAAEVERRCGSA